MCNPVGDSGRPYGDGEVPFGVGVGVGDNAGFGPNGLGGTMVL